MGATPLIGFREGHEWQAYRVTDADYQRSTTPQPRRRAPWLLAAVVLCGAGVALIVLWYHDHNSARAVPVARLSHAAFVRRANAACTAAGKRIDAIRQPAKATPSEHLITTLAGWTPAFESSLSDLRLLTPPPAREDARFRRMIDVATLEDLSLRDALNALEQGQPRARAAAFVRLAVPLANRARRLATGLHLSACGRVFAPGNSLR